MKTNLNNMNEKMEKTIVSFANEMASVRAGRANPAVLNGIKVEYYGTPTPIAQIASVSVPEAHSIVIQPWDATILGEIEKAINKADLGLAPQNDGKVIRLVFPQLTEDRRKELKKQVAKLGEDAKVAIRNIRRDAMDKAKWGNFEYTEDELAFSKAVYETYPKEGLPGFATMFDRDIAKQVDELTDGGKKTQNDFLMPYCNITATLEGSTDVGDVSWLTPTAQIHTATWTSGIPCHSWQVVTLGKSGIAKKGMILAAKVMAATAIDLYEDEELLAAAKAEFEERAKGGFESPIEDGAVPAIAGEKIL